MFSRKICRSRIDAVHQNFEFQNKPNIRDSHKISGLFNVFQTKSRFWLKKKDRFSLPYYTGLLPRNVHLRKD
jgi:hypothetical protein